LLVHEWVVGGGGVTKSKLLGHEWVVGGEGSNHE
jgi:hypothetical protein